MITDPQEFINIRSSWPWSVFKEFTRKKWSRKHWCWCLCFLWLTDGSLGKFTPGNWGEWQKCLSGTQTRQRLCQNYPPVYSGLNSSYQLYDNRTCGRWLLKGRKGDVEQNNARSISSELIPVSVPWSVLGYFCSPLGRMLVHHRVILSINLTSVCISILGFHQN